MKAVAIALKHRVLTIGVIAAIAAVAGILVSQSLSSGQQPSRITERRAVGPSGQRGPVDVYVPQAPSTVGPNVRYGPFTIVPWGGTPPSAPPEACAPADAAVVNNATAATSSDLFAAIGYIPPGFQYSDPVVGQVCGNKVRAIQWTFDGAGADDVRILRSHTEGPIPVLDTAPDGRYTVEKAKIRGQFAIYEKNRPSQGGPQTLYMYSGDVLTEIVAYVNDFSELIRIANTIP